MIDSIRRVVTWDVIAAVSYAAGAVALDATQIPPALRLVVVAPVLLFLPGYGLASVLFPGEPSARRSPLGRRAVEVPRLDLIERVAVSFGLSLALLPPLALAFGTVLGTLEGPVVTVAAALAIGTTLVGAVRRGALPDADRFTVPLGEWIDGVRAGAVDGSTRTAAVNVALAASVLLAVGAAGVAFTAPQDAASYTEFAVGTDGDDGFVAGNYPTDAAVGEPVTFRIQVENRERTAMTYRVVAQFERVDGGDITEVVRADAFDLTVEPGATTVRSHEVSPPVAGDDIRLTYLLYADDPPENPGRDSAYRSVHVWIAVDDDPSG